MRERSCEASAIEMGEKFRRLVRNFGDEASEMGEKFRRWVRNFNDEASKMREQMEKQRMKREKRT